MAQKESTTKTKSAAGEESKQSAARKGGKQSTAGNKSSATASSKGATGSSKGQSSGKFKMSWLAGIVVAVIIAIVGAIIAMLCINKPSGDDPTAQIGYSKSFFIYDDGKYSLWNADGKRLTEDDYQYQSSFIGGYALVKKDDQYGIIRDDGKMSVEFGKYGSITTEGGLYLAKDGNTKEEYLITGSGRVLAKGDNLEVDAPGVSSGFATIVADGKMRVYNYAGTLVVETEALGEDVEPEMSSSDDYGIVHYGDQNWVFDARNGAVVAKFEGPRYSFDSVSEDRTMILLGEYESSEDSTKKYKLIAGGKLYDLDETKYYGMTDLNHVIGYDNFDELALLDNDYRVAKRVNTYVQLKDANNYAVEKKDGGVEIYRNGELVKEFGEDAGIPVSGLVYNDNYAIEEGGKIKFYNLDGSVAFDKEFVDVDILSDPHYHAIVSENEGEYYLIDAKGNRVGDVVASFITPYDGGYKVKNSDGKYGILDKNGKPVSEFRYTEVSYRSTAEPRNLWTGKNENGMIDVIDADSGKAIFGGAVVDGVYGNYFVVKPEGGATEYYTLDGKLFYSKEAK